MAFIDQWNKKHGDSKRGLVLGASPTGDLSLYDRWVLSQNPKLKNKIIQHYAVRNGLKEEEAAKLQAQQAEAEKKQAYNESFVGRAKGVANKVSDVGEALYKGVASDFTTLGTGVGTAVGQSGGDVAKAQQAQTSTIDRNLKLLEQVNAQLKDPKTPGAKKIRLQKVAKMLNEQTQQLTTTQTADTQKTLDATETKKNVGALVNVGMLASGGVLARSVGVGEGLRAAEMTGQQILKNALVGTTEGAIGGVATGMQQKGATQYDLLKSAGIGAGVGGAIPLLATGIGKEVSHFRGGNKVAAEAPQVSTEAVNAITDNSHLLPEHAGTGADIVSKPAIAGVQDPALAVLQKGADPKNIKRLKAVEKQINTFAQEGNISAEKAKSLLQERSQLLESIRNPKTPVAKAIKEVDTKLSTATSKNEAASLTKEKTFLQEQALADARAQNIADDLSPTSIADTTSVDGVPVYGKSKLTPKAEAPDPLESLKQEARKGKPTLYNVQDEQLTLHRGTNDVNKKNANPDRPKYHAESADYAETYGKVSSKDATGRVFTANSSQAYNRINNDLRSAIAKYLPADEWKKLTGKERTEIESWVNHTLEGERLSKQFNKPMPEVVKQAFDDLGIDYIRIPGDQFPGTVGKIGHQTEVIEIPKPKGNQQLTDLYNQATQSQPPKSPLKTADDLSPTSIADTTSVDGVPVYGTGKLTPNQQSLKTEALAVKNGITEVAGDPRLTPSGSHEQWTTKVLATMNQDYEQAKKIATGLAPPPEGVPPNAFYRGVEARAIRENDGATIKALLDGPLGATSKAQGQNISALAMKDSESPLDMMKTVINARKKSNLNIPKTISNEEAQTITQLSNDLAKAREAVANGADRNLYGIAHANLYEYTNALTEAAGKKTLKEALSHPLQSAVKVAGVSKSLRATLDNSGLLRQGWKVLTTHPTTWAKNSVKSFEDLVRAFGDRNVMKEIHADVVSRPNAMNGLYKRMGIDVFGITEEAFPSSFPEKIPIFRRFYNASDAAYTGFLQRSRADLADKYLEIAQKSGVDLSSKKELQAIGKMVNSLTSRGHLGPAGEKASTVLNNVFFSPRMLKSNIDVLGGQVITGAGGSNFVRKRAALNLIKMAGSASAILTLANAVKPGSVEMNPQSANFGKIQVGDTRFDVTGGLSGLITLGSRIGPAIPGVPGDPATKSSTTGIVTKLNSGEFGAQSTADVVTNFFENKTAPAVSVIRDIMNQKDFNGNKPTVGSTIQNLIEPLIITNYQELKDNPRSANLLAGMIAEGLGVSVNTYSINSNWDQSTGKTLKAFKKGVGDRKFKEANTKYNESFNSWFDGVRKSDQFSKLGMEDRKQLITDKRTALQKDIMNSYGFQYKPMSKDEETKRLINDLKNMK